MNDHVTGQPVNDSTYGNHRCRCDGCKAAHTEYQRAYNHRTNGFESRVQTRATVIALAFLRENHPGMWETIRAEARQQIRNETTP